MKPPEGDSRQAGHGARQTEAGMQATRIAGAKETLTICPYCSVGCGLIVHSVGREIINIEGDPDNPVNEGALCAKGAATYQFVNNSERALRPLYRPPRATEWQEVDWDWALEAIARRVKTTRDRTFKLTSKSKVTETGPDGRQIEVEKDFVVNRTDAMMSIGSCSINNEECYLLQRLMRSWGLVYFDDKTRT